MLWKSNVLYPAAGTPFVIKMAFLCNVFNSLFLPESPYYNKICKSLYKMHKIILGILPSILFSPCLFAQAATHRLPFEDSTLHHQANYTEMPYNRLVQSAGKVITYGDPNLENHTLDLCALPDKQHIVIEDRYGIAVVDLRGHKIVARFSFNAEKEWQPFVSTYSGITAYILDGKTMISWGAASPDTHVSAIMLAEWDGNKLQNISGITLSAIAPAAMALPNQIVAHAEQGILYLYVVLNGNNQLLKINATNRKVIWTASTGVAPYGVCIVKNKAYVTNWAGPIVTDTTHETAGTPWGSAYTNPVTGATANGSISVFNLQDGSLQNEILAGLHPNAIIKSPDSQWLYVANANSDAVSMVNVATEKVVDTIATGLFKQYFGSSPIALCTDALGKTLYVANAMDNAIAVINLTIKDGKPLQGSIAGYIPTESLSFGHIATESSVICYQFRSQRRQRFVACKITQTTQWQHSTGFYHSQTTGIVQHYSTTQFNPTQYLH